MDPETRKNASPPNTAILAMLLSRLLANPRVLEHRYRLSVATHLCTTQGVYLVVRITRTHY